MSKPKVQTLVALISRVLDIIRFLFWRHGIPLLRSRLVTEDVVHLCKHKQQNRKQRDYDEHGITAMVQWLVVLAIDVCCDHAAELHVHVIASGGDRASADGARVAGREADKDGMAVGVGEEDCQEGEGGPLAGGGQSCPKCDL